jgi:hypothetical protein
MEPWVKKHVLGGGYRFRSEMSDYEAGVLRAQIFETAALLEMRAESAPRDALAELVGVPMGNAAPPDNPALARLLPDFQSDDVPGAANLNGALRSLHEPQIIADKLSAIGVVAGTLPPRGGRITLTSEEAEDWLAAVNDIRILLGTAVGITADTPDEIDTADPDAAAHEMYQWLTWLQDSLLRAVFS